MTEFNSAYKRKDYWHPGSKTPHQQLESMQLHLRYTKLLNLNLKNLRNEFENSYLWYFLAWTPFNFLLPILSRIAVTQCFEELAYFGIQFNLVTFLKTVLHDSNVTAARNYTNWQGTCYIAPLVGAIVADSYLGRYLTTVAFFTVYLLVSTQVSPFKKLSSKFITLPFCSRNCNPCCHCSFFFELNAVIVLEATSN